MQTTTSFTERTEFLGALLHRSAVTALGEERVSAGETNAYCLGYLLGVIAGKPHLYELVIEEMASLGVTDPR